MFKKLHFSRNIIASSVLVAFILCGFDSVLAHAEDQDLSHIGSAVIQHEKIDHDDSHGDCLLKGEKYQNSVPIDFSLSKDSNLSLDRKDGFVVITPTASSDPYQRQKIYLLGKTILI